VASSIGIFYLTGSHPNIHLSSLQFKQAQHQGIEELLILLNIIADIGISA